jgi:hypothetical protein
MGKSLLPMKDRKFVAGLVATLLHGLSPTAETIPAAVKRAH